MPAAELPPTPKGIVLKVSSLRCQGEVHRITRNSAGDGIPACIDIDEPIITTQSSPYMEGGGGKFAWFGMMDGQPNPLFYVRFKEGQIRHGEELKVGTLIDVIIERDFQANPGFTAIAVRPRG